MRSAFRKSLCAILAMILTLSSIPAVTAIGIGKAYPGRSDSWAAMTADEERSEAKNARRVYSASGYKVYGIDVSTWQGKINWQKVAAAGIDFAIMRAGYSLTEDNRFETYYKDAKAAGINVGAYYYCYATSVADVEKGADALLKWLAGKTFEYPIYIDMEDSSIQGLGKRKLTDISLAFCKKMTDAGYVAGVYSNTNWFTNYIYKSEITAAGYSIWQAAWTSTGKDSTDNRASRDLWQYYNKGTVDGITENVVDLDVSYFNYPDYIKSNKLNGFGSDSSAPEGAGIYRVSGTDALNMRTGPSTSYAKITSMPRNAEVTVLSKVSGTTWCNMYYDGQYGCCSMNYLTFDRSFLYTVKFSPASATDLTVSRGGTVTLPASDAGFTLSRASDGKTYTSSGWASGEGKVFEGGVKVVLNSSLINDYAGDDTFTFTEIMLHTHTFGDAFVAAPATCTENGIMRRICSGCGEYSDITIKALGHTEVTDKGYAPSCFEEGLSDGTHCSVCGKVITAQTILSPVHHYVGGLCTECSDIENAEYLPGDVNGDGEVNSQDSRLFKMYLVLASVPRFAYKNADVNGDGDIGSRDSMYIKKIIVS